MFLGNTLIISVKNQGATGASMISKRNFHMVSQFSDSVIQHFVDLTLKDFKRNLKAVFVKRSLIKPNDLVDILELIKYHQINTVFIDTSLIGNFSRDLKKAFKTLNLIAFFHNVEVTYFKELIRASGKMHHYFTVNLVKKAEKQLIKYADSIISLNERDSDQLQALYGRKADLIIPTSFDDSYEPIRFTSERNTSKVLKLLFVGSYFFPNIHAIDWFISEVIPSIKREVMLYVVGNGFDNYQLPNPNHSIKLIGRAEDLSEYYYLSDLVVAPIFYGSGMKTKIAEALMFNKPILGTNEAFEGYEIDITKIGVTCNSSEDFINAIDSFDHAKFSSMREVFLSNYDSKVSSRKFKEFYAK
jgi:glycosyltransferase involved in cell wall biosynthesis